MTTTVLAFIPSPSQGVWHLFGILPIRAYALCIITGIIAALVIGDRRWVARGGEKGVIYDVALWAVPFGLVGGRLYHVMTDSPKYFGADGAGFLAALRIWDGGLGIWGAVALGGVGAWIACRRHDIPLPPFADAIAPGIILAQAIGRLGNYFNQELYGRETDLPWGLTIYQRLDPSGVVSPHSLDGVSTGQVFAVVHPTFLYELLWDVLIFALLIWVDRHFKLGHGRLFALYVAGYCVGRFWVELMRSDPATLIAGIRVNTFTSSFVFIAAVVYIMVAPKGREDPATLRGSDGERDNDQESTLDELGEELTAVAATSGLVAAAKVASDDDEGPPTSGTKGVTADDQRDAGLGSVEGDEAADAEDKAPEVHEAAVAATAEAESLAVEPAFDGAAEAPEVPPVALEGTEVAGALSADAVDTEDADAEDSTPAPEVGLGSVDDDEAVTAATDEPAAVTEESTDGLGSVDADEVGAAQSEAADVHQAAVTGEQDAETLAEDTAPDAATDADADADTEDADAEDSTPAPEVGLGSVDDDEAVTAATDEPAAVTEEPTDGLGSVDGDEVGAAQSEAADVHQAAVTGEQDAETLAEDTAPDTATDADADADTEDADAEDSTPAPEVGLGSVDGDEAVTAATDEPAAVTEEPTDGLGSVDGDEVAAAEEVAPEVHEAAVEQSEVAEAAADGVAADSNGDSETPAEQPRRRWWRRG